MIRDAIDQRARAERNERHYRTALRDIKDFAEEAMLLDPARKDSWAEVARLASCALEAAER